MDRDLPIFLALAVVLLAPLGQLSWLQQASGEEGRVAGVVSAVAADKRQVEVRTESGEVWRATATDGATLEHAPHHGHRGAGRQIAFGEIAVGARVHLRGATSAAGKTMTAKSVVVLGTRDPALRGQQPAD